MMNVDEVKKDDDFCKKSPILIKILLSILVAYCFAAVIKLFGFLLICLSAEGNYYKVGRFATEFGAYKLMLDTIFIPISFFTLKRVKELYSNKD